MRAHRPQAYAHSCTFMFITVHNHRRTGNVQTDLGPRRIDPVSGDAGADAFDSVRRSHVRQTAAVFVGDIFRRLADVERQLCAAHFLFRQPGLSAPCLTLAHRYHLPTVARNHKYISGGSYIYDRFDHNSTTLYVMVYQFCAAALRHE